MAVISWTDTGETFYVDIGTSNVIASDATVLLTLPTVKLKVNSSYYSGNKLLGLGCNYGSSTWSNDGVVIKNGATSIAYASARSNSSVAKNTYVAATWRSTPSIRTNALFTSANKTDKTVPLSIVLPSGEYGFYGTNNDGTFIYTSANKTLSTLTVTLNVPPAATLGTPTYATPQYAGLGAYTVPITSAEAYYDGDISKVTLTVGQDSTVQTYSASSISNETISVTPTIAGTYTPTITVEDSRGQTKTVTLPQITVNPYLAPSLDFDVFRSNSSGVRDDEGAYGLVTANVSFTDAIADLTQPTVKINGTTTNNVTWYSAYSSNTGVSSAISDWTAISSGATIYGLINGSFNQTDSYSITVSLTDSLGGNSAEITQTLSTAFYTIDFQAGGKEIAFGSPANDDITNFNGKDYSDKGLFKCNMGTAFNDMTAQEIQDFVDGTLDGQEAITRNDLVAILNEVLPPKVADYVVEEGTSGIWTYVKWNSGRLECHGNYVANIAINTSSGSYGGYRSANITTTNFPVSFISKPTVLATAQGAGGWWVNNVADSNTTRPSFYLSCGASLSSSSRSIAISAYGRWK